MTGLSRNFYDDGTRRPLGELRVAGLPHCTPADIGARFTVNADVPESERAKAEADQRDVTERLAAYLSAFLPPGPCVRCGAVLGGSAENLLAAAFGTFTWGIAHGEGTCGRCGYPARGIHRVDLGEGATATFPGILQYHPDGLREPSRG